MFIFLNMKETYQMNVLECMNELPPFFFNVVSINIKCDYSNVIIEKKIVESRRPVSEQTAVKCF